MEQIRELWRVVRAMQRTGTVDSVNTGTGLLVVQWPEGPKSLPMPWLESSSGLSVEPEPGDQATVFAEGGDPKLARALVGVSSTDRDSGNKTGAARADLVKAELDAIRDAFEAHVHEHPLGPAVTDVPTVPIGDAGDVDSTKVQID